MSLMNTGSCLSRRVTISLGLVGGVGGQHIMYLLHNLIQWLFWGQIEMEVTEWHVDT